MNNKIVIIDYKNQDLGLNLLFPNSDYFIFQEEFDRTRLNNKYNINPLLHNKDINVFEKINDKNYDLIFIVAPLYESLEYYNNIKKPFDEILKNLILELIKIIKNNKFKKICIHLHHRYYY